MVPAVLSQYILELLHAATGNGITAIHFNAVGGGSINDTYQAVTNAGNRFFIKINKEEKFPGLFASEKQGLALLAATGIIRVPAIMGTGKVAGYQVLILEWIEQGLKTAHFWEQFGEKLAALHQVSQEQFGLLSNNYMGSLVQYNEPMGNWCDFFIHRRLEPQIKLALDKHLLNKQEVKQFERLYRQLPTIFEAGTPSLVHGDLWSGNFLCDEQEQPVLIDPAVYYGHNGVDLGMTTLFGEFDKVFYDSYLFQRPPAPNYREQWAICNIYPLLIHLNLFGKGYLTGILRTIERY